MAKFIFKVESANVNTTIEKEILDQDAARILRVYEILYSLDEADANKILDIWFSSTVRIAIEQVRNYEASEAAELAARAVPAIEIK